MDESLGQTQLWTPALLFARCIPAACLNLHMGLLSLTVSDHKRLHACIAKKMHLRSVPISMLCRTVCACTAMYAGIVLCRKLTADTVLSHSTSIARWVTLHACCKQRPDTPSPRQRFVSTVLASHITLTGLYLHVQMPGRWDSGAPAVAWLGKVLKEAVTSHSGHACVHDEPRLSTQHVVLQGIAANSPPGLLWDLISHTST